MSRQVVKESSFHFIKGNGYSSIFRWQVFQQRFQTARNARWNCSERNPKFTSKFWDRLVDFCGVKLTMSSSHHPQTDGASKKWIIWLGTTYDAIVVIIKMTGMNCFREQSLHTTQQWVLSWDFRLVVWNQKFPMNLVTEFHCPLESVEQFRSTLRILFESSKLEYKVT